MTNTTRMTTAHAIVRFLDNRYVSMDGKETKFAEGFFTIFDHDICPESYMVLGEVLNDRGNRSGYLPHRHPQPETYFFLFDQPEG